MMVIGIDAHKRSHTAVIVDDNGREHSTKTVGTTTPGSPALAEMGRLDRR